MSVWVPEGLVQDQSPHLRDICGVLKLSVFTIVHLSSRGAGGTNFERVKSGGKQLDDSANKGPQLNLGNKYTALQGGTE